MLLSFILYSFGVVTFYRENIKGSHTQPIIGSSFIMGFMTSQNSLHNIDLILPCDFQIVNILLCCAS